MNDVPEQDKVTLKEANDFLWKVINRYDTITNSTNVKSAILITVNTFIFSAIVLNWETIIHAYDPFQSMNLFIAAVVVFLCFTTLVSVSFLVFAIRPYLDSPNGPKGHLSRIFFARVSKNFNSKEYVESIRGASSDNFFEDLAEQVYALAKGLDAKFQFIRIAIWMLIVDIVFLFLMISLKVVVIFLNLGLELQASA